VAARSKGVGLRPLACWDKGFEPRRGHGYLSVVSVVCYKVQIYVSDCSLVQRTPTECGVPLCDREASVMRTLLPTRGCCAMRRWKINMDGRPSILRDVLLGSVAKRNRRVQHPKFEAWNRHKFFFWRGEGVLYSPKFWFKLSIRYLPYVFVICCSLTFSDSRSPCSNVSGDTQLVLQGRFSLITYYKYKLVC